MQKTINQIEYLARKFPRVVEETSISVLKDEWKLYQADNDSKVGREVGKSWEGRVDHYRRENFKIKNSSGTQRYIAIPKLVKSVLSLQNANAAVERSLSDNGNTCTKDRVYLMPETTSFLGKA